MKGKKIQELRACAQQASELLKGFGNPNRLLILCSLMEGEQSVGEILESLQISQPLLSQHLKVLREQEIISSRKEAQKIYYTICDDSVQAILEVLSRRFQS